MSQDLKIIKKKYGEEMMHFCRDTFASLLEEEGLLSELLLDHFEPNHSLYNDIKNYGNIDEFKDYIYNLQRSEKEKPEIELKVEKTPKELFDEAGYILYECKTEEEIQTFKRYYASGEELCTFNGGRLKSCHVFFAVKKNVDEIKRENFKNPERQDEYGTSVISIQFSRNNMYLSIKNRYNHTVINPDATFSNNLDNIIPGLTDSFKYHYGLSQNNNENTFELPNYVVINGKYYKYNYEIDNIYYCPNNVIIKNFKIESYPKEKYLIFDYFIVDLQNKTIKLYDQNIKDSFIYGLQNIKDIKINKIIDGKVIYITPNIGKTIEITIDNENRIVGYKNSNLEKIEDYFLQFNKVLNNFECSNLKNIGSYFLILNYNLEKLELPKVMKIEDMFLASNYILKHFNCPKLKYIGNSFIFYNTNLEEVNLPNVEQIGNYFLFNNILVSKINLSKLKKVGDNFLCHNQQLKEISLPKIIEIGNHFISNNKILKKFSAPLLKHVKGHFLFDNRELKEINLYNLLTIGDYFLYNNSIISKVSLPNVININSKFLYRNIFLKEIDLPKVEEIKDYFLGANSFIEKMNCPNLKTIGNGCLMNSKLKTITFPCLEVVGDYFMSNNLILEEIQMPNVINIGRNFLATNNKVEKLILPKVTTIGDNFLEENRILNNLQTPNLKEFGVCCLVYNSVKLETKQPRRIKFYTIP